MMGEDNAASASKLPHVIRQSGSTASLAMSNTIGNTKDLDANRKEGKGAVPTYTLQTDISFQLCSTPWGIPTMIHHLAPGYPQNNYRNCQKRSTKS